MIRRAVNTVRAALVWCVTFAMVAAVAPRVVRDLFFLDVDLRVLWRRA